MDYLRRRCEVTGTASSSRSTASTAVRTSRRPSSTTSPVTWTPVPYGSATPRSARSSSTSTGQSLDAAYLYNKHGAPLDHDLWQNLRRILGWLSDNWQRPDEGIWEVRGRQASSSPPRSCAGSPSSGLGASLASEGSRRDGRWISERDKIYEEIIEKGWNPAKKSFVQYYGSDALDASLLLMPLTKFVGPTDPRWLSTLDSIQEELHLRHRSWTATRRREAAPDGLQGDEGSQPLLLLARRVPDTARLDEARLALEKMFSYSNLGLYAEEIGPAARPWATSPRPLPTSPS